MKNFPADLTREADHDQTGSWQQAGHPNRYLPAHVHSIYSQHRRRINKEEKAKVVAALWRTKFIQFLAELANLH